MNRLGEPSLRTELAEHVPSAPLRVRTWLGGIGRLFPRNPRVESVATTMDLAGPPHAIWERILFYEEVPRRPAPLLQIFLPRPVRTDGNKTQADALVRCTYERGHLVKRITTVEPPSFVSFDVLEQHLGIEDCISMTGGSYTIRPVEGGSQVVLTTNYRGHLRPRWLWRPLERYLAHQVHRHILEGMREHIGRTGGLA